MRMVYQSLNSGLMASHQISPTTENLANLRKKATNEMKLTKIRWEDALNITKASENKSERARQDQITTHLKKLKHHYYQ